MDPAGFRASLSQERPPADLGSALGALWHAGSGDWARAHALAQQGDDAASAWVHAYLHRVEGDSGNAAYWYRRAARAPAQGDVQGEWEAIAHELLAHAAGVA